MNVDLAKILIALIDRARENPNALHSEVLGNFDHELEKNNLIVKRVRKK